MTAPKQKLPRKTEDHVVDLSIQHVVFGIGGLFISAIALTMARDYAKFKRQQKLIESATQLIIILTNGGDISLWNEKKTAISSTTKTLSEPEK